METAEFYDTIKPSLPVTSLSVIKCVGTSQNGEWMCTLAGGGGHQNTYTLDLQVWRPSPTVDDSTGTGQYSLVGNNSTTTTTQQPEEPTTVSPPTTDSPNDSNGHSETESD